MPVIPRTNPIKSDRWDVDTWQEQIHVFYLSNDVVEVIVHMKAK